VKILTDQDVGEAQLREFLREVISPIQFMHQSFNLPYIKSQS
jgi:hypothetical protein